MRSRAAGRTLKDSLGQLTAFRHFGQQQQRQRQQVGNKLDFCLCLLKGLICCAFGSGESKHYESKRVSSRPAEAREEEETHLLLVGRAVRRKPG